MNRAPNLEELSQNELANLDARIDDMIATHGTKAFSEVALNGLTTGYPGLLVARQMQRNTLARSSDQEQIDQEAQVEEE